MKVKVKSLSPIRLFVTPCQAPPSMGFSRQEYWSGLPFPSPGNLSNPGLEPGSCRQTIYHLSHQGGLKIILDYSNRPTPITSVFQFSHVWLIATSWTAPQQASLSITNSWSLLNSCPLSQWCHPTISSSVIPFSSCLQSFPASGSFLRSQFFASGGQSIGASASASVLPRNIQDWTDFL